ncbi:acyltransferase [Vibrio pelagius]|uniref:Acyltransferase n=1 Tax=Vibrio pelagius TaxID=28169 RepID=A0ABY5G2Y5_VIBPE|nr:acyltransferase [Vibrio pelagius]UTT84328.1 acyltransferase [Vibrio pelagius]
MNQRFTALDSFRGICAIAIVVFHTRIVGSITEWEFFRNSSVLVEFFFVLSGFVMAHVTMKKDKVFFKEFMASRAYRLYPLHIFMLLVFIVFEFGKLAAVKFAGFDFNTVPFTAERGIAELIPNALLVHSWTNLTLSGSFNYTSWSISVEMLLYLVIFFTCLAGKNRKIFWVAVPILAVVFRDILPSGVYRGLTCFFLGALTYVAYLRGIRFPERPLLASILEVSIVVASVCIVSSGVENSGEIATALFAVTVWVFAHEKGVVSRLLRLPAFTYLGTCSYSIYLTHSAVLFVAISAAQVADKILKTGVNTQIDGTQFLDLGSLLANNAALGLIVCIVIAISSITYRFIEKPGIEVGRMRAKAFKDRELKTA